LNTELFGILTQSNITQISQDHFFNIYFYIIHVEYLFPSISKVIYKYFSDKV